MNFVTWFEPAIPIAMPMPNATTTTPHPAAFARSVVFTKIGPSASTAPTAANAITMPAVIADAIESSRRNRSPSTMSRQIRERSNCSSAARRRRLERDAAHHHGREGERAGVQQQRAASRAGATPERRWLISASTAKTAPPSGSVAYVLDEPDRVRVRELSPRHQVRQRRVARRRPQQREAFDHERQQEDRRQSRWTNAIVPYSAPRATSASDHDLLAVEPVDERAGERSEQDRGQHPGGHHAADREAGRGGGARTDVATERRHRDEPDPVPERRDRHRRQQPGERRVASGGL